MAGHVGIAAVLVAQAARRRAYSSRHRFKIALYLETTGNDNTAVTGAARIKG
jgi:hypothetical protein